MRKTFSSLGLVTTLFLLTGTSACQSLSEPAVDDVKSVRILEQPDPRTLYIYGHVTARNTFSPGDADRGEELTLERLKAAAKRAFPEATVLFDVTLQPGDTANTLTASGIAGRRRGA